jgi:AmmeMemoRadiSam system protein A
MSPLPPNSSASSADAPEPQAPGLAAIPAPSPSEFSSREFLPPRFPAPEFSPEERILLLGLAHEAILSALERRDISTAPPTAHLAERRGVFTSLHLRGQLRGCVGYVLPSVALYRAVIETARASAFEDSRFYPVTAGEAPALEVELSILSVPQAISPEAVQIGCHGLIVTLHGSRGLLLPQVAVDHAWDRTTFLDQTCRKAGLPLDAWRHGATIEAFTAEIFGDGHAGA